MNKKIIVIGCTGQDGSYLTKSLLKKGFEPIGISRSNKPNTTNHERIGIKYQSKIIRINRYSTNDLVKLIEKYKPIEIYNLSAQSSVGLSLIKPEETFRSIVDTTRALLEAARKTQFSGKLFFAGSSEIFGETRAPATIKTKTRPCSPYGLAKLHSKNLVEIYRDLYAIQAITGILFNHESPLRGENFVTQRIIEGAINCGRGKQKELVLGNLNIKRDWGWAEDFIEAMQLITRAKDLNDHVICTGKSTSLKSFVIKVFQHLDLDYKNYVVTDPRLYRKRDIKNSLGNPNSMKEKLNWSAKNTLIDKIDCLIESKLKSGR